MFRERGREGEKHRYDREALVCYLLYAPQPGTEPATQACALTGSQTGELFALQNDTQPSDTGQGRGRIFFHLLSGDPAPLGILGCLSSAFLSFIQQMFPECDCASWLISVGALQDALGSHSRGIWARLEVREGISDEVPFVL